MTENLPDTNVGNIEYIRKNDASDWLKQYGQDVLHGKYKFSLMYIWKNIMDLPSADVAPVVRCKDCLFFTTEKSCCRPEGLIKAREDDFCSYGERKE